MGTFCSCHIDGKEGKKSSSSECGRGRMGLDHSANAFNNYISISHDNMFALWSTVRQRV